MGYARLAGLLSALLLLLATTTLPAHGADYKVGPEDTLTVTVVDHPELGGTVVVAADGAIQLPVIGALPVAGKTIPEVTDAITQGLRKRLKAPEVYVILAARNPQVYALGAVVRAGIYPLAYNRTALELLTSAGSLSQPVELCSARVLRKATGQQESVALADLLAGKPAANLSLREGDVLIVEGQPAVSVYVAGEVVTPGVYQIPQGGRLSLALGLARGLARNATDLRGAILRKGALIPVDLTQVYAPGGAGDLPLQAGDVVRIESTLIAVTVAGEVRAPGVFSAPGGTGALEAINLAGGATPSAQLAEVVITNRTGATRKVDLSKGAAVALADGDRLYVPAALVQVMVTGEVRVPGTYPMTPSMRAAQVLALAGGPTPAAALTAVQVLRASGAVETIDATKADLALKTGDRVYVPSALVTVTVTGEVQAPGTYQVAPTMPLADVVTMAGGTTPAGALKGVQVVHAGGAIETLDLAADRRPVRDGDRLIIPARFITVVIGGAVRAPGSYAVAPTLTVPDLVTMAGGLVPGADDVLLVRADGASETVATNARPALRDGDRITVRSSLVSVQVSGEVRTPGIVQVRPRTPLADVLALAGGPTPAAALGTLRIAAQGGAMRTVDVKAVDVTLADGDRIIVPSALITVVVSGEVKTPGAYQLGPEAALADALLLAGGALPSAAVKARIIHAGGAVDDVDLAAGRVALRDGDRIYIASNLIAVAVAGEVKAPGTYQVTPGTTVQAAVLAAGGATPLAATTRVQVVHVGGAVDTVDLTRADHAALALRDGDRILIATAALAITVVGEVQAPGAYQLAPGATAQSAIAAAGGATPLAATTRLQVLRVGGAVETIDLAGRAFPLEDGDRIFVPSAAITVTVAGEVKLPGSYPMAPGATVADALTVAGGMTPLGSAKEVRVARIRGGVVVVDIAGQPVALQNGDRILVPAAAMRIEVSGEVKAPGSYPLTVGGTVADALALAGGPTPAAALRAVRVARAGGALEVVDTTAGPVVLRDGDRVIVPTWLIAVAVSGEVKTPGTYQMAPGMTVADALAQAGGLTMSAALDRVQVLHLGGAVAEIGGDGRLVLKDGDRILVPSATVAVAVTGEVKASGRFQLSPRMTVADAVAAAGGPTPAAGVTRVRVLHLDGTADTVSLGDTRLTLREGDHVTVPTALVNVTVSGEVLRPGNYQVSTLIGVADVIAVAGGPAKAASLGKVQVIRAGGDVEIVDATATRDGAPLAALRDGDRIVVPTTDGLVSVWGHVRTPGLYPIDTARPFTVSEAISKAAGVPDDNVRGVTVTRQVDGKSVSFTYKLADVMNRTNPAADRPLLPGDAVFVQKKPAKDGWRDTLSTVIQVLTLLTLVDRL